MTNREQMNERTNNFIKRCGRNALTSALLQRSNRRLSMNARNCIEINWRKRINENIPQIVIFLFRHSVRCVQHLRSVSSSFITCDRIAQKQSLFSASGSTDKIHSSYLSYWKVALYEAKANTVCCSMRRNKTTRINNKLTCLLWSSA